MLCDRCKENKATVHVTEIVHLQGPVAAPAADGAPAEAPPAAGSKTDAAASGPAAPMSNIQEQHLCERCAEASNLPNMPAFTQNAEQIWKLLQSTVRRSKRDVGLACPECGMTLLEFRQRGRLGCPRDYEVFAPHLRDLLERIHGATRHAGRSPGVQNQDRQRRLQELQELQNRLREAVRSEAYEDAARLRDEIKALDQSEGPCLDRQGL